MAVKYYSDGTYTKGDGKLYRPGIGVVGNDKSTNVSKAESGGSAPVSSSSKTSSSSSKTSSSNKTSSSSSGGVSSMYKNNSSSSTSILDKMMDNVKNNPISSGGSSSNVSKTDSGWYVPSGSVSTTVKEPEVVQEDVEDMNPYAQAYMDRLQSKYDALNEQIREQNRLAVEQGTNRLEAQKSNINQSAEENARQAYVQYMQSQKALPQQLASQGITGGATETANLGLSANYQNNVNSINQNKANALQEIDNAIMDLKNSGDLAAVEQVLANNQAALDAYKTAYDKGVSYNQWAQQFNAGRIDAARDYEAQQLQAYMDAINEQNKLLSAEKKEERDLVLTLYREGRISRDSAAAQLGYDPEVLYDTMGYVTKENELALKDKQMDISNTQSLINSRKDSSGSKGTSASLLNSIINTATKMLNEREDVFGDGKIYRNAYDANDVKAYILSQNISDEEQYNILNNLGLI